MIPILCRILIALSLAIGLTGGALAEEVIESFDSRVEVQADGDYIVTETITVRAEGLMIKRGIYRDFPTYTRLESGLIRSVGFSVEDIMRDGRDEPWHTERIEGGERIYIGDADVYLDPGTYRYEIRYRTSGQLGHHDEFDEVYWNATGDRWAFPIEKARATIVLPPGAKPIREAFYSGVRGSRERDARVVSRDNGQVVFETIRPLRTFEGLTVAVAFDKGIVPAPGPVATAFEHYWSNAGFYLFMLAPLAMLAWYAWAWRRVGRDPPKGIVIPLFSPPDGISPAAASYVYFRGQSESIRGTSRALIAALMSLAVKGRIRLDEAGSKVRITRLQPSAGDTAATATPQPLPPGELALLTRLLGNRDSITLERANAKLVRPALTAFSAALNKEYERPYFRRNYPHIIAGVLIAGLAVIALWSLFRPTEANMVSVVLSAGAGFLVTQIIMVGITTLTGDRPGRSRLGGLAITVAAAALPIGLLILVYSQRDQIPWPSVPDIPRAGLATVIAALAMGALVAIFKTLMFAPTPAGRQIGEQVEGFRTYLSVAESGRMNLAGQPDFSTSLFERYLPYAIALGVEKPWSKALEQHLAKASPQERASYQPSYFHGSRFGSGHSAAAIAGMASSLGASVASAAPSSSGSGGGGSSGGGGGGGGGGGW
ncbi:MAG: DUF2207 domain-containing protein [Burkholderiaceae bacterium]